jgi:hypothetical protein
MKLTASPGIMIGLLCLIVYMLYQWQGPPNFLDGTRWDPNRRPRVTAPRTAAPSPSVPSTPNVVNPNGRNLQDPNELIRAVSETYDVPAGILYGIWRKESDGLRSNWGTGNGWYRAPTLVAPGGRCIREYNADRCNRWWQGLQAVCNQRRNGAPICDPAQVYVSYAYAMGPMQVLPSVILDVHADGTTSWTANAADFDRDGVVDPHSLPDAMAIGALEVRHRFDRAPANLSVYEKWIWAANGYYGSQTAGYYEGTTAGRRGIQDHWRQWCEMSGDCGTTSALAAR